MGQHSDDAAGQYTASGALQTEPMPARHAPDRYNVMSYPACAYCNNCDTVIRSGFNATGSQRYQCRVCKRYFTADPKDNGYSAELRQQAHKLFEQNVSMREIARQLDVNHQTIANWIRAYLEHKQAARPDDPEKPYQIWSRDEWRKRWQ